MGLKSYVAPLFALVIAGSQAYLTFSFMASNYNVPEGTVFTLSTLGPSFVAVFLALIAFITLLPRYKRKICGKMLPIKYYWALITLLILLSLLMTRFAVQFAAIEYTQFQASLN